MNGYAIGGLWGKHDCDAGRIGCAIAGLPDQPIEGVSLHDIDLEFIGGGSVDTCLKDVPDSMGIFFGGDLPAFGFYVRHVRDLDIVQMRLRLESPDDRPAVVLHDVQHARIAGLSAASIEATPCLIKGVQVRDFRASGIRTRGPCQKFLELDSGHCHGNASIVSDEATG